MYLVPIHVPVYLEGHRKLLTTEWRRSLELLRDSFGGRFGQITVIAPSLPASAVSVDQQLVEAPMPSEGIELLPSFDLRCRAREFWLRHRARWRRELVALTVGAQVVHAGLDDLYRPIAFEGFRIGVRLNKPTLFIQDTDIVVQQHQLFANRGALARCKSAAYGRIYERACRWSVARADLSLLKGSTLMQHYGRYAKNAREFHDTSFSAADIADQDTVERRLSTLSEPRPRRLVYCGRLAQRKGVDRSLEIIARAKALGADLEFDVIGDGGLRHELESLAAALGIAQQVRFLGALPYDAALLQRLARYDALLFTPTAEDTPRMIFDAYAAGLPLVAFDIAYVRERHAQEHATYLLPLEQVDASAAVLVQLCRDAGRLSALSRRARAAAEYHCAESWYRRRAQWTFEAVERHNRLSRTATAVGTA